MSKYVAGKVIEVRTMVKTILEKPEPIDVGTLRRANAFVLITLSGMGFNPDKKKKDGTFKTKNILADVLFSKVPDDDEVLALHKEMVPLYNRYLAEQQKAISVVPAAEVVGDAAPVVDDGLALESPNAPVLVKPETPALINFTEVIPHHEKISFVDFKKIFMDNDAVLLAAMCVNDYYRFRNYARALLKRFGKIALAAALAALFLIVFGVVLAVKLGNKSNNDTDTSAGDDGGDMDNSDVDYDDDDYPEDDDVTDVDEDAPVVVVEDDPV